MLLDSSEIGSMRSSELAEHASVSRATVTGLLDTLEKAGLIARTPDARDRRASCVRITDKGRGTSAEGAAAAYSVDGKHPFRVERHGSEARLVDAVAKDPKGLF